MNHILKRISPLAIVFIALAAALALSPSANAQSTSLVQIEYAGDTGDAGKMVTANTSGGADLLADNDANFRQHWDRTTVSSSVFRFSRQGFNSCLRAPDALAATAGGSVQVGSCSGTRAQWRRVAVTGTGDMYVNVATGHVLSPPICIIGPCSPRIGLFPLSTVKGAEQFFRWTFDFL